MPASNDLKNRLVEAMPNLRAFAISLCGTADRADDLVQETLVKAWNKIDSFEDGTNLKAWLFTILRNTYFSQYRKGRRELADTDGEYSARLSVQPQQQGHVDVQDLSVALNDLPDDQREALVLVAAEGFSYEQAAAISNCAVGTIKSRVSRARTRLLEIMQLEEDDHFAGERYGNTVLVAGDPISRS
jgi:RNA polymerase sigma-70 factor (ECF subfamily)